MSNIETEYKYIVKMPSIEELRTCEKFTESRITQIYIYDTELTHRVRKREYTCGRVEYTENTKRRLNRISSVENEREITEAEYTALAGRMAEGSTPVIKTRRTVLYCGLVFEFDFYPHWEKSCIMEVEIPSFEKQVIIPPFIEIIADVTGVKKYSNHSMSQNPVNEADHL